MMNQQINLYQDRFKDIQPPMSAVHAVMILGTVLVMLVASSFWYHNLQATSQQNYDVRLQQKQGLEQELATLRKELQAKLADTQVEQELQKVSMDIEVRQRMIDFVSNNQFGAGEGFSDNLAEIARLEFGDVWLSEISLGNEYVRLSGSALKAENVPQYFNRLQDRELFEGRVFELFEVDRTRTADWKVDFVIASRVDSDD